MKSGCPILNFQTRYPLELLFVIGNKRGIQRKGVGGDQHIVCAYFFTASFQVGAQLTVACAGSVFQRKNFKFAEKQSDGLAVLPSLGAKGADLKFEGRHHRYGDIPSRGAG